MFSQEILKGTIKPLIIKMIKEEGRMYGYQITQKVKEMSLNKILITEGALYPALHKLLDEGFLITESERIGNRERKYYRLSETGLEQAMSKLEEVRESILVLVHLFDLKPLLYETTK
ncbi:PadR family transcriptional regulator [Dysgonomonas sp. ZJ279]|uniref:PadR family transcriptional regulator n=1 Tax=Dysgonomonas sp. ZJ279 TaxID=2709796 RepID=UPI0013ECB72C|nr:helix-turn-helix transcriptional regulator [Dysgonomonas sp. ZJ279]